MCCLVCLLTMSNRCFTVRLSWLAAIQSDAIRCRLEWYRSASMRGSLSRSSILLQQLGSICFLCMVNTNEWWCSQLLFSKLSFNGWPVMPHVRKRVSAGKFLVPYIFGSWAGIRKYLYTKIYLWRHVRKISRWRVVAVRSRSTSSGSVVWQRGRRRLWSYSIVTTDNTVILSAWHCRWGTAHTYQLTEKEVEERERWNISICTPNATLFFQ